MAGKKRKILIIDDVHPVLSDKLSEAGYDCDYMPDNTKTETENVIGNYFGLVVRSRFAIDKSIIDKAGELKFIGRLGSGLENIDTGFAYKKGIKCINSPEGNKDAVGEHALGILLALSNNLCRADREVRQGIWKRKENRGNEIQGRTVGIIGYGNTGSAFAKKLQGFEVDMIAYDKYKNGYGNDLVRECSMKEIFQKTDILSLHIPLTEETLFLVNDKYLKNFSRNIILINTSRGKIVKTDDLVKNLASGRVSGAALDVLEYESSSFEDLHKSDKLPEAYKYLASSDKVVLTPHIAGLTYESNKKLAEVLADKIIREYSRCNPK